MKTRYEFAEVLNDTMDYFLVGDIFLLRRFKEDNDLDDDIGAAFTSGDVGDGAVREGIIIPMRGIKNYPYTVVFTLDDETPELLKSASRLQIRRDGYALKIENRVVLLYTWRILRRFTDENVNQLLDGLYRISNGRPMVELENGWYQVDILAGELSRDGYLEPAFEFVLKKVECPPVASDRNSNYLFELRGSAYDSGGDV